MDIKNPFEGYEAILQAMSRFGDILKSSNTENMQRLTDSIAKAVEPNLVVDEIVNRQKQLLASLNIPSHNQVLAISAIESQWNTLSCLVNAYRTPEIDSLQKSLIQNDFGGLLVFADSLKSTHTEAANIALIKMAPIFEGISFPRGIKSAVNGLHVDAAKRLLNSESVSFDIEDKKFYVEDSPDDRATVAETNILCSSLQLFSDIDEADLISFLTHLEKYPPLASEHETGKRILDIISQWTQYIDFDCDYFYHARSLPEGACPYTEGDLKQAPKGYTGHGRYNYAGQSHYYFSDVEKGAILEVTKHTKDTRIQIAKLHPTRSIRMIDLSEEITSQNKFLEYCRFNPPPEQYPIVKREYLLPCFVASCCKKHGIEGIKYYGSKEYRNYVSWDDGYFDIVNSRIQTS